MLSQIEAIRNMMEAKTLEEIMEYCKIAYPMKTPQEVKKFSEEILAMR